MCNNQLKLNEDKTEAILFSNLTMKQHVIRICQTAYYELKRISSIRRYLTEDAAKQLVTSCVLSRLNYCNSVLMGTPNSVIQPMQKVQNTAASLILRAPRHQNCTSPTATPLAPNFWTNKIQHYLHVLQHNHRFRSLLSFWAATPLQSFPLSLLFVRHTHAQNPTLQPQNPWLSHFLTLWPHIWNNLPQDIRHSATLSSFKSQLKTFLFSEYFS